MSLSASSSSPDPKEPAGAWEQTQAPPGQGSSSEQAPEKPGTSVRGYVEAAYHANLSEREADVPVPLRVYDRYGGNNFILHAAHFALNHGFADALSAVVELDVGQDAGVTGGFSDAAGRADLTWVDLQEAYFTYRSRGGLRITGGKFVTYQGIEVIEGPSNPTITRGFLFGFAEPFTHVGVKAEYAPVSGLDLGFGVVNGWDVMLDNNDSKTIIFRAAVAPGPHAVALSGTYGAERPQGTSAAGANSDRRVSLDVTGKVVPSEALLVNFQLNYGAEPRVPVALETDPSLTVDASWLGFGVQPVYTRGTFSLGMRVEWFQNTDGVRAGVKGSHVNTTLTPGLELAPGFVARAEYRLDSSTRPVLADGGSVQHTVALAAHHDF